MTFCGFDRITVGESVASFQDFLSTLDQRFDGSNIRILAHSLGCRLVGLTATAIVEANVETTEASTPFANVVLAAPDVDVENFENTYAPALTIFARRVTVYHSRADVALTFARTFAGGQRRIQRLSPSSWRAHSHVSFHWSLPGPA